VFFISICRLKSAQIPAYGKLVLDINTVHFHNYADAGCHSDCGVIYLEKS